MNDLDVFEDVSNPLDCVEEILSANDWIFNRMNDDEISVQVTGKMGEYTMHFMWDEDYSAVQFSCDMDLNFHDTNLDTAAKTVSAINATLWLGHFDIKGEDHTPRFRHTSLFRGMNGSSGADHIEDLVEIAIHECERYYPLFNLLCAADACDTKMMGLAMMDAAGVS